MGRSTTALFWIICGAIFVTTVYLLVVADVPSKITDIFNDNKKIVDSADNGATPAKATLVESSSTEDSIKIKYNKAENATRYRCYYGEEKGNMKYNGVVYVNKEDVDCKAINLKSGTKYYTQMISINGDKQTASDITSVTTK